MCVLDNGIGERMFVEDGKEDDCDTDPYGETTPEKVLAYLQSGVETL